MEKGGGGGSVGPTNNNSNFHSHSHSNTRPVRAASRYFYGGGSGNHSNSSSASHATFSGPVRRWEKKWVHVSSSQPSTTTSNSTAPPPKPRKFFLSNGPSKPPHSPILLRKWTPLSRPPPSSSDHHHHHNHDSGDSRRKFRYTPITVFEEKKRQNAKGVADGDKSGEADQSADRAVMDSEDIYGLLDINNDLTGGRQGVGECDLIYTRRSHLNLGLNLENKNRDHQPDLNMRGLWATN